MLYYRAARTLLQLHQQAESPLYFLFVHTIALAFKAYLRSRGIVTPRGQRGHALRTYSNNATETAYGLTSICGMSFSFWNPSTASTGSGTSFLRGQADQISTTCAKSLMS